MRKSTGLLLFVALCLFACVQGTEMEAQAKKENILLVQMETGYVVDDVLDFLKSFQTDIQSEITTLNDNVRTQTEYVSGVVADYNQQKNDNDVKCAATDLEIKNTLEKINQVQSFIYWITNKTRQNEEKIEEYNRKSCNSTLEFVEYIRNAHNSLNFIAFLRKAIENYSFIQMKAVSQILSHYDLPNNSFSQTETLKTMLLELTSAVQGVDASAYTADDSLKNRVSARTSDQIGTKHIDNDKGEMDLNKFQNTRQSGLEATKSELIALLDKLQTSISAALNDKIQNQIQLSEATADFITYLEHENSELTKELIVQKNNLTELLSTLTTLKAESQVCHETTEGLVKKINDINTEHQKYLDQKAQQKSALEDQLTQLTAIIEIYENKIVTAGATLKKRYDDILDNNTVDYTASVDDRELTIGYDAFSNPDSLNDKIAGEVVSTSVDQNDDA